MRLKGTTEAGQIYWLHETETRGYEWVISEASASDMPTRLAELYLRKILANNRHLEREDRIEVTLVKDRH